MTQPADQASPPALDRLYAAIDATWPPAARIEAGPWLLREGRGGGKRVSAATPRGDWREEDIVAAEEAMRLLGQTPLFMLTDADTTLDAALAQRGYAVIDPVNLWHCPAESLTDRRLPPVTAFTIWEPLAIMREIWEASGIGAERQTIMERAPHPKTSVFGRVSDKPAGCAFVAIHNGVAMLHALEILPEHRKKGLGAWMMRAAAIWAARHHAQSLAVLCTRDNTGANALYAALGMQIVGGYHYRILPQSKGDTI